ncbi:unnamed protein product, partial [Allacma fusca]
MTDLPVTRPYTVIPSPRIHGFSKRKPFSSPSALTSKLDSYLTCTAHHLPEQEETRVDIDSNKNLCKRRWEKQMVQNLTSESTIAGD